MKALTIKTYIIFLFLFFHFQIHAAELNYNLSAEKITDDTYVFFGSTKHFTFNNGGNIVNTSYIVTEQGIIVIDTGPSLIYGNQMRQYIEDTTNKKVLKVFITHHHPDHFLGNQAYKDVPIASLEAINLAIYEQGEGLNTNLYTLVGDWMKGTEVHHPTEVIKPGTVEDIGGHKLEFIQLDGHTHSDLAILDHTTGVLFTGDLVFNNRTPTTPHANINKWSKSLELLNKLDFKFLVPGHGPALKDNKAIIETKKYIEWLDNILLKFVNSGADMSEALHYKIPESFHHMDVLEEEYQRSILQLYPRYEADIFIN
ncbi:MAG: quinoprotein relay system zinc metallohydrolase 1 [Proteobacteria bacterium]|nr:quinoprotein relay system zinc metallohydrolase 1 [Pseudomonadota bacterium]